MVDQNSQCWEQLALYVAMLIVNGVSFGGVTGNMFLAKIAIYMCIIIFVNVLKKTDKCHLWQKQKV